MESVKRKKKIPWNQKTRQRLQGGQQKEKKAPETIRLKTMKKKKVKRSKDCEIDKLRYLASRKERSLKSDFVKHVTEFQGTPIFLWKDFFSAFKSPKDYFIAEFGEGYAIFVDGKLKKAVKDKGKVFLKIF